MKVRNYYIQNTYKLDKAIANIKKYFPCKVTREYIEMDYSKVSIETADANYASIERVLAPLI